MMSPRDPSDRIDASTAPSHDIRKTVEPHDPSPTVRLLHLVAGNLYGGVETFLATLARHQHVAAMEHQIATCFEGRLSDELRQMNAPHHLLRSVRLSRPLQVIAARRSLKSLLQQNAFDAVVTHLAWPHVLFGPVVQSVRLPLIHFVHTAMKQPGWLDRRSSRIAPALLIGCSRYATASYASLFPATPATTVYPPVALPEPARVSRDAVREALGASATDVVILQVSRMEPMKGHDRLLAALSKLTTTTPWTCWIVGGPQRDLDRAHLEKLRQLCHTLNLSDRVRFLGERRDVPDLLAAADLYCQFNTAPEGLGISLIEASRAGLPIMTTRLGPASEIVTDAAGVLVDPEASSDSIAASLSDLIDHPDRRRAMGIVGRDNMTTRFDPIKQLAELGRVIRSAIQPMPTPT